MATSAAKGAAANPALGLSPLSSPGAIYAAAKALTDAQTQGPLNQLANQIAQNNRQTAGATKLTGGYFNSLGQYVNQGNQQIGQIGSNLNDTLARIGGETQAQLQGLGANAQASLQKYSPSADAAGAPNSLTSAGVAQLANEIARQGGLAAQANQTERAFGAIQGANYQGLGASHLQTYAQAGQEALKGIAQAGQLRNQPLETQRAGLISNRGALLSANEYKIRQQEISNQATNAALGIKQSAINTAAKTAAAGRANTAAIAAANRTAAADRTRQIVTGENSRSAADRASRAAIAAANRAARGSGGASGRAGGGKPLTTGQNNTVLNLLDHIANAIPVMQKNGLVDSKGVVKVAKPTEAQIRSALGTAYPAYLVQAAYELLGWGHITPKTAAAMHSHGIRGGTFRNAPIRVAPPPLSLGFHF